MSNKVVNLDLVNSQTGKYLHRFGWLKDCNEIGKISLEWNWLVGWYKSLTMENRKPYIILKEVHG